MRDVRGILNAVLDRGSRFQANAVGPGGRAAELHADATGLHIGDKYTQFFLGDSLGAREACSSGNFDRKLPSTLKHDDALFGGYEQRLNDQTPQVITQPKEFYHSGNAWKKVPIVSGAIGHRVGYPTDGEEAQATQVTANNKSPKGRLDILDQIDNTLSPHTDGLLIDAPKRNLLKGYGGVGKTTLAAWYARSHREEYEVVIWFQANEPLEKQFQERAHEVFGLPLPDESNSRCAKIDLVKSFYATLSQFGRWLIVFDDVKNPKDIAPFLPRAHTKESYGDDLLAISGSSQAIKKGCLITSRYNQWGLDPSMVVFNLDGFTPDEVMDFLSKRLKKPYSKEEALRLSAAFDAHPYALQQAANYINQNITVRNITQYLKKLEAEPELVFSDESAKAVLSDDASYSHHVLKAMSLSVDDFLACSQALPGLDKELKEQVKHLSLAVIGCLGYLNPGKLSYSLVASIIEQAIILGDVNPSLKKDASLKKLSETVLGDLHRHGIVRLEEDENGCEGESFVLHQLMRLTFHLRKYQQNPEHIHRILLKAFASCVIYDRYQPEKNAGITPYINQASYYLNANHSNVDEKISDDQFNLCVNLGEYYLFQYDHFDEAYAFFLKAEACLKHLACSDNSSKEKKARLFNGMGFILHRYLDEFDEALDYLKKTLALWGDSEEKVSHLLSARALCSMGCIEVDRRHSNVAKAHYDAAHQFLESANHKSDKVYAIELSLIQSALGDYYLQDGYVKKAKQFYFDSEKQRETIYPDAHPELHILRNKIVEAYKKENNYDAAIKQLEKMASIQRKHSGYTIDYLDACYQMAACYQEKSEPKKAEELRSKNLNIIKDNAHSLCKQKGFFNKSLLYLIVQFGHLEALQLLIEKAKDHLLPKDKKEALWQAAYYGYLSMLKLLVNEGVSSTASDKDGMTPLIMASFKGHLPIVEWLLDEGKSSLYEKNKDGHTALLLAAYKGHLSIVKALVGRGASPTESNKYAMTPLLMAFVEGHLPVVEWLLNEKKSSLNEKAKHGYTALLLAAKLGHLPIVQALVGRGASPTERNKYGMTPLLMASLEGHLSVVEWLLDEGKSFLDEKDKDGNTALLLAAYKGHLPMVKALVGRGASVAQSNHMRITPLLMASAFGHLLIVEWLLDEGKSSLDERSEFGDTALLFAAYGGHLTIVQYLVDKQGASSTERNKYGMTPLLMASTRGHLPVMEWLLDEGKSSLDEKDKNGYTALLWAAQEGRLAIVKALVSRGSSPAGRDKYGMTPLLMASMAGHLPVVEWLLDEGRSSLGEKNEYGDTALLVAAQKGHLLVVKALVGRGASSTESNNDGVTPLLMASANGHLPVVEWLLDEGKSSLDEKDKGGQTALLWAAQKGHLPIVKALVGRGASSTESRNDGITPLLMASANGHLPVVEWLLSEEKSSLDERDEDGDTALLWAAREGYLPIVQYLADRGASPTESNNQGMTPLLMASFWGHLPVVEWLLEDGKSSLDERDEDGDTALLWAAREGYLPIVQYLADRGASPTESNKDGVTPLLMASAKGHLPVVEWLLDEGKSFLNEKDKNGDTALLWAARKGYLPIVQYLVGQGASPTESDNDGMTPLILASALGHLPVVEWLLDEGKSSLGEKDKDGDTALLWASREGHLPIVKALVGRGASPTESNNHGMTPLLMASVRGHLPVMEWLLSEGKSSLDEKGKNGNTAASLVNDHTESVDAEAATSAIASSKKQVSRSSLFQEPKPQYLPHKKRRQPQQ